MGFFSFSTPKFALTMTTLIISTLSAPTPPPSTNISTTCGLPPDTNTTIPESPFRYGSPGKPLYVTFFDFKSPQVTSNSDPAGTPPSAFYSQILDSLAAKTTPQVEIYPEQVFNYTGPWEDKQVEFSVTSPTTRRLLKVKEIETIICFAYGFAQRFQNAGAPLPSTSFKVDAFDGERVGFGSLVAK